MFGRLGVFSTFLTTIFQRMVSLSGRNPTQEDLDRCTFTLVCARTHTHTRTIVCLLDLNSTGIFNKTWYVFLMV